MSNQIKAIKIAVVGSRKTTDAIMTYMGAWILVISKKYPDILWRSGGCKDGPDNLITTAAQIYENFKHEIYVAKPEILNYRRLANCALFCASDRFEEDPRYKEIIRQVHPNPNAVINQPAYLGLHARNFNIISGMNLDDPVNMVIYAAPIDNQGNPTGGTRTGILYAKSLGIPCFNFEDLGESCEAYRHLDTLVKAA